MRKVFFTISVIFLFALIAFFSYMDTFLIFSHEYADNYFSISELEHNKPVGYWHNYIDNTIAPALETLLLLGIIFLIAVLMLIILDLLFHKKLFIPIKKYYKKNKTGILFTILFILIIISFSLSFIRWTNDATLGSGEWYCADGYCIYADKITDFFKNRAPFNELSLYIKEYIHSQAFLVPVGIAFLNLFHENTIFNYILISGILSICSLFIFYRICLHYKFERDFSLLAVMLLSTHLVVIRTLVWPVTDAVGLFFILLAVYLFLRYDKHKEKKDFLLLFFVLSLGMFSRISFIVVPFIFWFYLNFRHIVKKGINLKYFLMSGFIYLIPYVVFFIFLLISGSFQAMVTEVSHVSDYFGWDLPNFIITILATSNFFLFFVNWKKVFTKVSLNFTFVVIYILSLIAINTPFRNRYFLPIIPFLIILSLEQLQKRRLWIPLIIGFNLLIVILQVTLGSFLPVLRIFS